MAREEQRWGSTPHEPCSSASRTGKSAHRTEHHHVQIRSGEGGFGAFHIPSAGRTVGAVRRRKLPASDGEAGDPLRSHPDDQPEDIVRPGGRVLAEVLAREPARKRLLPVPSRSLRVSSSNATDMASPFCSAFRMFSACVERMRGPSSSRRGIRQPASRPYCRDLAERAVPGRAAWSWMRGGPTGKSGGDWYIHRRLGRYHPCVWRCSSVRSDQRRLCVPSSRR